MLESLEYTARIRPRAVNAMGDDLPDDMHHDYTLSFGHGYVTLCVLDDGNKEKRIPITRDDLQKINEAFAAYDKMLEVASC